MHLTFNTDLLQPQQFGEDGAPWMEPPSSASPPAVSTPAPAPFWSPPTAPESQGAAIAGAMAMVYAPTEQPDYSAYNSPAPYSPPMGGFFTDVSDATAAAWGYEQQSAAQAASAAAQHAVAAVLVEQATNYPTYIPGGKYLGTIKTEGFPAGEVDTYSNGRPSDETDEDKRSKLRSPDGQTYCPPSGVYGHRDNISASGDWFANNRMIDALAPGFGESGDTMQRPPEPTRAYAIGYNTDKHPRAAQDASATAGHMSAQLTTDVVAWGQEGADVSASGDRFPNNRMIDAVASAFGESGEMMQRPAVPTRAQAANYNTAPHVGQALLSANAPTILQHERTAEAGQSPEVNPAIEKARQEMTLLLQDPLNQELLAYYTAHIEQKQATWTPSPWSSTPPSLAQLPDTEQGQFMTERYGVELATQLYRLDLAMRQVRDSYAQAVDQAVRDKPTSPSQAGPVGLVTHVEPPPAWWDVHPEDRATGVDRFDAPAVRFEFNLQAYTDHYLQQDSQAAKLFKALYGDQITTTQFKPPGADSETIRYQHIGGEQFQVRLGEQVEYGPNLSRSKWIATSVGDSDTGELIRIDLAHAPKMHDAAQVFFDPTMGWVTTAQNIDSAEFFDKAFPILVGAAAGFFAGPALAGMVNLGGNVVATAAFGAATSTAVSGLIVNGRIDFGDVIKSALTAAFTAGITDALKLDTMGTAINADGVRVVTDWGQRLLGAAGQITLSGFAAELSGADFADGIKGGVASVVSQEIVRGLQIKIGEMGDLSAAAKSQLGIATRALGAGIRAALTDGDPLQALAIEYLQGLGVNVGNEIHAAQEQQTALAGMDHEYEIYNQQDSLGNMPVNGLADDDGLSVMDLASGNDISDADYWNSPAPTLDDEPATTDGGDIPINGLTAAPAPLPNASTPELTEADQTVPAPVTSVMVSGGGNPSSLSDYNNGVPPGPNLRWTDGGWQPIEAVDSGVREGVVASAGTYADPYYGESSGADGDNGSDAADGYGEGTNPYVQTVLDDEGYLNPGVLDPNATPEQQYQQLQDRLIAQGLSPQLAQDIADEWLYQGGGISTQPLPDAALNNLRVIRLGDHLFYQWENEQGETRTSNTDPRPPANRQDPVPHSNSAEVSREANARNTALGLMMAEDQARADAEAKRQEMRQGIPGVLRGLNDAAIDTVRMPLDVYISLRDRGLLQTGLSVVNGMVEMPATVWDAIKSGDTQTLTAATAGMFVGPRGIGSRTRAPRAGESSVVADVVPGRGLSVTYRDPATGVATINPTTSVGREQLGRLSTDSITASSHEIQLAAQLENATGSTIRMVERPAPNPDGSFPKSPDFVFESGPNAGRTGDFMFTIDSDKVPIMNANFNRNWIKTEGSLNDHLIKANIVVLDFTNLTPVNQLKVTDWINTLSPAQRAQIWIRR